MLPRSRLVVSVAYILAVHLSESTYTPRADTHGGSSNTNDNKGSQSNPFTFDEEDEDDGVEDDDDPIVALSFSIVCTWFKTGLLRNEVRSSCAGTRSGL